MTYKIKVKNSTKRTIHRGGASFPANSETEVSVSEYQQKEISAAVGLTVQPVREAKPAPEPEPEQVTEPEPEPKKATAKKKAAAK